jgi:hypothetical protein
MKRNQESRRSLFLQYDLPTSLTSPEATAITLHRLNHRTPALTRPLATDRGQPCDKV